MFGFRRDAQGAALLGSARVADLLAGSGVQKAASKWRGGGQPHRVKASSVAAGIPESRIAMSGVAKTDAALDSAIAANIFAIQAESATCARQLARQPWD